MPLITPEPMPLVDTILSTPEPNIDMNTLQDIIDNLGLLNESQGIPVIPQIPSPIMPLLDVNPQIDFPVARNTPTNNYNPSYFGFEDERAIGRQNSYGR